MYERFTDRAERVMQLANREAQYFDSEYIRTEHILLGLLTEGVGGAATVLYGLKLNAETVRLEIEKIVTTDIEWVSCGTLRLSPRAQAVIEHAEEESRNLNHNYVGTEHLLLGLLREEEGVAAQVLMLLGLSLDAVRTCMLEFLGIHNQSDAQALDETMPDLIRIELHNQSDAQVLDETMPDLIRIELHRLMEQFDRVLNLFDTAVREVAVAEDFQHPIKLQHNFLLKLRSEAAKQFRYPQEKHTTL